MNPAPSRGVSPPVKRLVSFYRLAHPEETKCAACKSSLRIVCVKQPSPEHPRGVFSARPCAACKSRPKPVAPNKVKPWFRGQTGVLSALHKRIKAALCCESLGFVSEQAIGPYRCDEVHHEKRVVIEINGDYVHANPKLHKPDDVIVLERDRYKASERWARDAEREKRLEALGYRVFVVWESDDMDVARESLWWLLRNC